jgi:hypothetical protein
MDDLRKKAILDELANAFGSETVTAKTLSDGRVAFRIEGVALPTGCSPRTVSVLLLCQDGTEPQVLVRQAITLKNGASPRNLSPASIDGEPWMSFSANFPYDSSRSMVHHVFGKLGRFGQIE